MRSLATNIVFENHQSAIRATCRDAVKVSIYILSYRIYLSVPSISDRVAGFWSYDIEQYKYLHSAATYRSSQRVPRSVSCSALIVS